MQDGPAPKSAGPLGALDPKDQGARQIMDKLESLSRRLEEVRQALAEAAGLRPHTYALLTLVANSKDDGINVSDAALQLGVRPQALSTPVGELCQAGLMERTRDPGDGRARRLSATSAGKERLAQTRELKDKLFGEVIAQIPAANVAGLILGKLDQALNRALA